MFAEEPEIKEWKKDLEQYQKQRKEQGYKQEFHKRISHKEVKQKEVAFHPILQVFRSEDLVLNSTLQKMASFFFQRRERKRIKRRTFVKSK